MFPEARAVAAVSLAGQRGPPGLAAGGVAGGVEGTQRLRWSAPGTKNMVNPEPRK